MMKLRKQSPQPQPAANALAALVARLSDIRKGLDTDQAELRRLDQPGVWRPPIVEATAKLGREARELLNGAAEGLLPPLQNSVAEQIRTLKHKIEVSSAALEEGGKLVEKLKLEAATERYRLREGDVKAAMTGIVDAVLALEVALQRRESLLNQIKPPAHLIPGAGWALLGRLGRSESMAYRFTQAAVEAGWIPEEKFNAAVKQSRTAM